MAHFTDEDFQVPNVQAKCDPNGMLVCVSVALGDEIVAVRDTKDKDKNTLNFSHQEWRADVQAVKLGQFDV